MPTAPEGEEKGDRSGIFSSNEISIIKQYNRVDDGGLGGKAKGGLL